MTARACLLAVCALTLSLPAGADTIYVDDNCTATQDGSAANPYCTIQDGILAAAPEGGDTVRVKPGTYRECLTTLGVSVVVIADDVDVANRPANSTVIDGTPHPASGFAGCNDTVNGPFPAVELTTGSRLEGFTVKGGGDAGVFAFGSVVITRNVIEGNEATAGGLTYGYGGGISFFSYTYGYGDVAAEITSNTIRNNTARQGGGISALSGAEDGTVSSLLVKGNTIQGNTGEESGGGIDVATNTGPTGTASAVITKNTVTGNSVTSLAAYYGYGAGIWVRTLGPGTESIQVGDASDNEGNTVSGNSASVGGGGISAWLQAAGPAQHTLTLEGNTVSSNTVTDGFGGGMELFYLADDMGEAPQAFLKVSHNDIASNTAAGQGGGIGLFADVVRTDMNGSELVIEENILRTNVAGVEGAGAHLAVVGDANPDEAPTAFTEALVHFENNLVRGNDARTEAEAGTGGGVQAELWAFGPARSDLRMDFNTVVANRADVGGGGVDVRVYTAFDTGGVDEGEARLRIANSILTDNEMFAVGGSDVQDPANTGNLSIDVRYTDLFGNASGSYEDTIFDLVTETANLAANPLLDAQFVPNRCGPAQDAADPGADFSEEPAYNGGRANLGHTGGTVLAASTLPDVDGSGRVDGIDVLRIAAAFAAVEGAAHYNADADLDLTPVSGVTVVDGTDLSLVTAFYGQACP